MDRLDLIEERLEDIAAAIEHVFTVVQGGKNSKGRLWEEVRRMKKEKEKNEKKEKEKIEKFIDQSLKERTAIDDKYNKDLADALSGLNSIFNAAKDTLK